QSGCNVQQPAPKPPVVYPDLGYRPHIPSFMKGTIYEVADVENDDPYSLTAYSLVVNLQGTGDNSNLPRVVRDALLKRIQLAGFGSANDPNYFNLKPDDVLNDARVAVVQVEGRLPVGARQGQRFDVIVRAEPGCNTTSLAHGRFYQTDLFLNGWLSPESNGQTYAYADNGDVFVNPKYALLDGPQPVDITAELRKGVVMGAGVVTMDRPIYLHLTVPEARIAREIEARVIDRFQTYRDRPAAEAEDPGLVSLYVPTAFNGDWQHFVAIVDHLYLDDAPDANVRHVHDLMEAAQQPGAPLMDISYCLEGMGAAMVPLYSQMIEDPNPGISYCAARAAACVGDDGAVRALVAMAIDADSPYQLAAVHTLGQLPQSPLIDRELEGLLSTDQRLVRVEAYNILASHQDRLITSENINNRFILDIVDSHGPPLVYATVQGLPRLAIFGDTNRVTMPITYMAMNHRLSISSDDTDSRLSIFYRDPQRKDPVHIVTKPSLIDLAARLGGIGPADEDQLSFSYGDVVAILQSLCSGHCLVGTDDAGNEMATDLMLQPPPELEAVDQVASVGERPQGGPPADPMLPPGRSRPAVGADDVDTGSASTADTSGAPENTVTPSPSGSSSSAVPSFGQ
ncbi:MAG TPA: flagellar basal body P-ring protein FlgI, partial [Tepidisphaeraceae bacterium]|nr:flagellar basal body P-ring protein FlgI [Tepidisphaeraceae bacterium]